MEIFFLLLAMAGLLLLEGFFSGSEIAIVHCDKTKLRHKARQGDSASKLALKLFERPEVILSTTLVGTNIALVVLTVLATTLMIGIVGGGGDLYAVLLFSPFLLILGQVVPKSVFQQESDTLTPKIIYPLYLFSLLFFPIVFVFSRTARLAARLIGHTSPGARMFAAREQLRVVLETTGSAATMDVFDRTRIRNVIRFGEFTVGDIMVPASELTAIDAGDDIEDAIALVGKTGHSHIPVYEGQRSNIVGMVSLTVWDLLQPDLSDHALSDLTRPAYFVPAQQPLAELLPILRNREDQSAIVVDEYGSAVGMITAEVILETVVGRVEVGRTYDEQTVAEKPTYEVLEEDSYLMDARLPISEVNELLATKLGRSEAHTIGGLMVARLRHVPAEGESLIQAGYKFTVVEATERAVTKLLVERVTNS